MTLFVPTTWNPGAAPGISAPELNRMEAGIRGAMPVGTVISAFHGVEKPGWLKLDGSPISRALFPELLDYVIDNELIGSGKAFGDGDGSTTFIRPDMRQRVQMMPVSGDGGDTGGLNTVPSHAHTVNPPNTATTQDTHSHAVPNHGLDGYSSGGNNFFPMSTGSTNTDQHNHSVDIAAFSSVSNGNHDNRPAFIEINFFIAT